jgi:hypothetical protein
VAELRGERDTYAAAVALEATGVVSPGLQAYGLELLLRAGEKSRSWREVRRRRKLWQDPVAHFAIFLCLYGGVLTLALGIGMDFLPLAGRAALVLFGATLTVCGVWYARNWLRGVREEDDRDRISWQQRRAELETRLDEILSG